MKPFFSLIIPTYNRCERITSTINSVLNQDYSHFEILIIDDGSTDQTEGIVKSIAEKKIWYYKKGNEERAIARNYGIERASGNYITFLDSDDKLYPHYFSEACKIIAEYNDPEWLHLAYEIKDEQGKVIRKENKRKGNINDTLITGNHLSCIGVFVRKDVIRRHQFNEDPDIIGSEDYILWMELASRYRLRYSNRISACMVQHTGRSVENFDSEVLIKRINKSIDYISQKKEFHNTFSRNKRKFIANRFLYLVLHLLFLNERNSALKYLWLSIKHYPVIIFSRKILALMKNLP